MRRHLIFLAAVIVVCVCLYWPAMHGPFLFDDFPNLAALASIDHVGSWRDLGIYLSQQGGFPGRPLAMLSFLPQKAAWPDHPFPFKVANLIVHLINGVLVYRLTWLLCHHHYSNKRGLTETVMPRVAVAAILAAAAWLLNPIQISGVLLVVQRMTLLMATFVLLGLLAYLKGLLDAHASPSRRGAWMASGLGVCMVLAFLCKENGVLLPLFAMVLDATVLRPAVSRLPARLQWWRRLLIWPTVLIVFGYLLYAGAIQWNQPASRDFSMAERLLTEPRILFDYLGKIFLPRFGVYGLYNDGYAISHNLVSPLATLFAVIGLVATALLGWFARRRWPLVALAIFWYLGGQIIESSTVMLELYFEHRNYVPTIGLFVAIAIGLAGIHEPARYKLMLVATVAWLVAGAFALALSSRVYSSADRLAVSWAYQQPDSVRAQSMLARQLFLHGNVDGALATVDATLDKYPNDAGLAENRVYLKCAQGSLTADDMQQLARRVRTDPFDNGGFGSVKTLRLMLEPGKCPALNPQSWKAVVQALLDNPNYAGAVPQGSLHYQLHEQAVTERNLNRALHELDATNAHDPDAEIPRLKAQYLASAGLYDQAIEVLKHADYARLPLMRRLWVNDKAINAEAIQALKQEKAKHSKTNKSARSPMAH